MRWLCHKMWPPLLPLYNRGWLPATRILPISPIISAKQTMMMSIIIERHSANLYSIAAERSLRTPLMLCLFAGVGCFLFCFVGPIHSFFTVHCDHWMSTFWAQYVFVLLVFVCNIQPEIVLPLRFTFRPNTLLRALFFHEKNVVVLVRWRC